MPMIASFPRRTLARRTLLWGISAICSVVLLCSLGNVAPSNHTTVEVMVGREPPVVVTEVMTKWIKEVYTPKPPERRIDDNDDTHGGVLRLGKHNYRSDGLVDVNPNGAHPIYELIRNAEAAWNAKLKRSSKTLAEAVLEYKRRYKRLPPKGFDAWWAYVQEHNVQLPDEYDQIYEDLEPFWGMDPRDLQRLQGEWEGHSDSYTIGKTVDGPIMLVNVSLSSKSGHDLTGGSREVMELLKDVEHEIPPFRAVFSPHDNPNLPTDRELREMALKHAAEGTFLDIDNPPPVKLNGWLAGCPPTSPAVLNPIDWDVPAPPPKTKRFIHTHKLAMDPCLHPSLFLLQGQFLSHHKGPIPHRFMVPQFSYSSTMLHHDILPAMLLSWVQDLPNGVNLEWEKKGDERLLWRGSNTGMWHSKKTRWRESQRARAVMWAGVEGGGLDVSGGDEGKAGGYARVLKAKGEKKKVGKGEEVKWARWAPAMLDIAFAMAPGSCAPETCDELGRMFEWKKVQDKKAAGNYKYVLDIDGNGWSSRFKRLITSNSLIFKATIFPEWFTDRIAPWVHYVPVQADLSDLADSLTFFRGDPNGDGAHDALAQKIAMAGREWSLNFWRKEDLTAYMFRPSNRASKEEPTDSDDQASEPEATDHGEMWVPSSSESEDFGDAEGADVDGMWDVEIIGEEVAMNGWGKKPDIRYVAQWKNWTRADGTNVTWTNELLHEDDIQLWTRKEAERRKKLAEESTDIDVDILTNLDVHLIQTQYRRHAVEEKLKRHAAQPYVNMEQWTERNMALAMADENDADESEADKSDNENSRKNTKPRERTPSASVSGPSRSYSSRSKQQPSLNLPSSSRSKSSTSNPPLSSSRTLSRALSTAVGTPAPTSIKKPLQRTAMASTLEYFSSSQSTSISSSSPKVKGKQRAISQSPSFEEIDILPSRSAFSYSKLEKKRAVSPWSMLGGEELENGRMNKRPRVRDPSGSRRRELEDEWTAVARRTRAAPVRITNDVDKEETPPLPENFRYLESEYYYSSKVPMLEDKGICQDVSELFINGKKAFAYTKDVRLLHPFSLYAIINNPILLQRLFNLDVPQGVEVVECNSQCGCDPRKCPNRVAQQPRDVPIEVFKTVDRGWGVRSPMNIKRGKVLGIYTGLLIRRDVAVVLPADEKSYLFDLDGREGQDPDVEDPEDLYSVDSRVHGNWTRFINHSCDPNLIIYLVVYDTIPDMNMPYIAFVAAKDIPAGTEFSFDYDPRATKKYREKREAAKGKPKYIIPKGRKPCSCGSGLGLCRGYV
ncbi:hypothetical protein C0995_002978 [Termitomyces sp. Mi166|nr:hypothetical protein C0995_002978 [Termitomyces sp. Mi166\